MCFASGLRRTSNTSCISLDPFYINEKQAKTIIRLFFVSNRIYLKTHFEQPMREFFLSLFNIVVFSAIFSKLIFSHQVAVQHE